MRNWIWVFLIMVVIGGCIWFYKPVADDVKRDTISPTPILESQIEYVGNDKIVVEEPKPGQVVTAPLTIRGKARGSWFFEASFPVSLVDDKGAIIAQGAARAQGDWMSEDWVPFRASLDFVKPEEQVEGKLILKKDNPSGMIENDDELEIKIRY